MRKVVRFAVIGEGRDEHGVSATGPSLHDLDSKALQGALVTIVSRLLRERFGQDPRPVRWVPPLPGRAKRALAPGELLTNENYLHRFLEGLLRPVRLTPSSQVGVEFVVLSVDLELRDAFERSRRNLRDEVAQRTIPLVFEPELEILFVQGKEALEDAVGLPRRKSMPPGRSGDLKSSLSRWLATYAPNGDRLSADLRSRVARHLDISPTSPLEQLGPWRDLVRRLEALLSS